MSNYPPPGMPPTAYPQPAYPPPPQPSGCGCGGCLGKLFMLLGVLFFLMIVVCCGGGYLLLRNSVATNAAGVDGIKDEITTMQVPQPLQPVFAARIKQVGEEVIYAAPDQKAIVRLTSFSDTFSTQYREMVRWMLESVQNQPVPAENGGEELKDLQESIIERTIRGEKVQFHIYEGVGVKSGTRKIRVDGEFKGKSGPTVLTIRAEEATLSREKVDAIIQSIDGGGQAEKK